MKQVTLNIPDNKFSFFMELVKNLGFAKEVSHTSKSPKSKLLRDLEEAVDEVNLMKKGKLEGIDAKDLINEL